MEEKTLAERRKIWKKYNLTNQAMLWVNRVSVRVFKKKLPNPFDTVRPRLAEMDAAQEKIKEILMKGEPALIARFGSNEAWCTAEGIGIRLNARKNFDKKTLLQIHRNAGVFPSGKEMALRFSEISEQSAREVDMLGYWSTGMQNYLVEEVCKGDVFLTGLANLEPYYSTNPWSAALKGKKVLVIHPFKESIEKQYQKRELLFENPEMLPEFDLQVMQAVQTIAGQKDERFEDWEQALNYMHQEAMKYDFDVAIIGCGAYGMSLGAKLKQSGKIAIHLGGATQILFGIKGSRWDNHPVIGKLYNEHWVRPSEEERPKTAQTVENACYW